MTTKTIPAISIIIPMYNTEKYIGECLDSILAQTFKDFEVIVVDDCSTDNSCDIVEKYLKTGKIKLVCSQFNSGGAAVPRNTGIRLSRGEYVMFVDSDDIIMPAALEELFDIVEKFNPEVIHCLKFYDAPDGIINNQTAFTINDFAKKVAVKQPTMLSKNLVDRVEDYVNAKIWTAPWNYLFRRDFILKNDISFPDLNFTEDAIFIFYVLLLSETFLNVPNVFYIYRQTPNSIVRKVLQPEELIGRRGNSLFNGIPILDAFMQRFDFFQKNPQYKYKVFDFFARNHINCLLKLYTQIPAYQLDGLIRRELEQIEDKTALTAFLFNRMNVFNVNLIQQQNLIRQQQAQIQQLQQKLNQIQNLQNKNIL